jgi:hypothetical protein
LGTFFFVLAAFDLFHLICFFLYLFSPLH